MTKESSKKRIPVFYVSRTDDSGVFERVAIIRCRHCGTEVIEKEYEEHLEVCHVANPRRIDPAETRERQRQREKDRLKYKKKSPVTRRIEAIWKKNPPRRSIVNCPHCGVEVREKNLARHLKTVHPRNERSQSRTMTNCPECGVQVREKNLARHLGKVHQKQKPQKNRRRDFEQKAPRDGTSHERGRSISTKDAAKLEALRQSLDERRDGGKYLGYMSRESGKFGSLPLYDDYGDESEP
jgi:endogenous inhibitor of DNA gyrase (YacG/DUF329 family)